MNPIRGKLNDHAAKGYSQIDAYEHDLQQIYLRARNRIEMQLSNFLQRRGASFTGPRLISLFEELNAMFPEFEEEYRETYEHALEYMAHQNYAAALQDMGLKENVVGSMDKSLFENMRQDGFQHIAGATRNMQTEVISELRRMSARVMREANLTGMTRAEVSRHLAAELLYAPDAKLKDFQFIDAGGRRWKTEKYFNMLGRTLLHNNARECYLAGCAKGGSDIVTISVSGDCCDACGKYENALLSISGATPGLPTLEEAMAEGLFHPNCTHRIIAVPESVARKYYGPGGEKKPKTRKRLPDLEAADHRSSANKREDVEKNSGKNKPADQTNQLQQKAPEKPNFENYRSLKIDVALRKKENDMEKIGQLLENAETDYKLRVETLEQKIKDAEKAVDDITTQRLFNRDPEKKEYLRIAMEKAQEERDKLLAERSNLIASRSNIIIDYVALPEEQRNGITFTYVESGIDQGRLNRAAGFISRLSNAKLEDVSVFLDPNQIDPITGKEKKSRPHYDPIANSVHAGEKEEVGGFVHELCHGIEKKNPHILQRCIEFLDYRCKGETSTSLRSLTGNDNYKEKETARKDHFFKPYCGKDYLEDGKRYATEILSMGMEKMYENPRDFYKEDPEYFSFCFNVLRGVI